LTFPNGAQLRRHRRDLVITAASRPIGRARPAADRFYAFDKKTGELVWSSTERPAQGQSFSHPYVTTRGGKRVLLNRLAMAVSPP